MEVFSDADFSGDGLDLKSMKGVLTTYNEQVIAWRLAKITMVDTSMAEAEYIDMEQTIQSAKLVLKMAIDTHIPIKAQKPVWCDN